MLGWPSSPKLAGNRTVSFTLFDPNKSAVDTTSTTPLPAGKYTLVPSEANAASFGYSVTAHPGLLVVQPADLTLNMRSLVKALSGIATTLTVTGRELCVRCYTAPNANLLTTDTDIAFYIQLAGRFGTTGTYQLSNSSPHLLTCHQEPTRSRQ